MLEAIQLSALSQKTNATLGSLLTIPTSNFVYFINEEKHVYNKEKFKMIFNLKKKGNK